ncbi:MAG: M14 family zinc carboxypeptidase [Candidatus Heimdallarchaeota archaeon]
MLNQKTVIKSLIILFLVSLFIPNFTQTTQATLVLEEPTLLDVPRTWSELSLLYDNLYHNTSTLWQEISAFAAIAPQLVDVEIIGESYYNKAIKSVRITNELRTQQKAKTLVVSHHHGREQISVEIALRFILSLLNAYGVDTEITDYINTQEIYIIPTINPDALDIVINDNDHWLRKNARPFDDDGDGFFDEDPVDDVNGDGIVSYYSVYEKDGEDLIHLYNYLEGIDNDGDGLINEDMLGYIDLNRNYDAFFRDGYSWDSDSQGGKYPGVSPFSEPETQVYRDFALKHRFAMAYSLHSGVNATFFARSSEAYTEPALTAAMMTDFTAMLPSSYQFNDYFLTPIPGEDPTYPAGVWDPWMYFERASLAPISIELWGNLTSISPESDIPIVDNSTHLIIEWKEIYNHYNPYKENINSLWFDVQPIFPYLLENTPRLNVNPTLYSIVDRPGSLTNLSFTCTNLSPKIRTITPVEIFNSTGTKVFEEGYEILADSTVQIDATVPLPFTFNGSYEIKIGNEFVGYHHFILKIEETTTPTSSISFSIIGLAVVVIGISSIISLRKRK